MQIERAGHFVRPFSHGRVGLLGDADVVDEPPREFAAGSVAREFDAGRSRRALDLQRIVVEGRGRKVFDGGSGRSADRSAARYLDDDRRQVAFLVGGFPGLAFGTVGEGLVGHGFEREVQVAGGAESRCQQRARRVLVGVARHGLRFDIADLGIARTLADVLARNSVLHGRRP